ncbi:His Kinase A domain containing protein [Lobosporangium transversale]|nr:His Kinase A domain containing protein [Lobosporangium transversale]
MLLKGGRWARGQTSNWTPSFASDSSSSLRSVQRRPSDCVKRPTTLDQGEHNYRDGCASLGLDTISVAANLDYDQTGLHSSVNHLKENGARARRVSESSQNINTTPFKQTGFMIAERLSEFAQRISSRLPNVEQMPTPSPSESSDSSYANFTSPLLLERGMPEMLVSDGPRLACLESEQTCSFKTWDDYLELYGEGRFPNNQNQHHPHPLLGSTYPHFPEYVKETEMPNPPPFLAPPLPPCEEKRLRALYSFQALDSGSDLNFQRVAQLVSTVLGVKGCMICLVDHRRVAIKAQYQAENMECNREFSLSGHAILRHRDDPLIILDASKDWRFKNLPAVVSGPKVRFYAGAALATSDGLNIGSLCIIDPEPRAEFTDQQKRLLIDFAAVVMREMEHWNDQVQLCTRTRMMRDITRWVRGCLDMDSSDVNARSHQVIGRSLDTTLSPSTAATVAASAAISALPLADPVKTVIPSSSDPNLPTPSSSPMLITTNINSDSTPSSSTSRTAVTRGRLQDEAFPVACSMIQGTLIVDAVYLVQVSPSKSFIPANESSVVWNYLGVGTRPKGAIGTVGGDEPVMDMSDWTLTCLASSAKPTEPGIFPNLGKSTQHVRREGKSLICADGGCRPHRVGELHADAVEPHFERDKPIISEMLRYVRQEKKPPPHKPSKCPLYVVSQNFDGHEIDPTTINDTSQNPAIKRISLLCHTFQSTLQELKAGKGSPFKSSIVMPIRGASSSSSNYTRTSSEEPWAYFVVLTSSYTKQFTIHERMYLKNFGSCLITEVLKERMEAADKAKGVFIKRTPLHIILGTLELLYNNPNETLNDHQLSLIASAEASGKGLIDTINNIIDLADLDPEENSGFEGASRRSSSLPELYTHVAEVDIRDLCEQVAGSTAKACLDKNIIVTPTWSNKSNSVPLSDSASGSTSHASATATNTHSTSDSLHVLHNGSLPEEYANSERSSVESQNAFANAGLRSEQKPTLELLVAMDEPEKDPSRETAWNFLLNLPVTKRILTQFTTTGFVEISAVSPPLSTLPLKPPNPDARPILFTVRDTGRGISPEFVQAHLFQRFTQEDPLQVGTGLGLALVKLLVESLGGWLEIWSEGIEGKGCVVRVLIWATPVDNVIKSLKDEPGAWQEKSCRFYTGESAVSTDRLWKIMGERMMCQDLNMNVERGNEQDISPEDMLKNLSDHSPCDLLIFNDDLIRLKAYLLHLVDRHAAAEVNGVAPSKAPTPLLMLTSAATAKKARHLVDAYKVAWKERGHLDYPANVVLMPKPIGPLKLMRCLYTCFEPININDHLQSIEAAETSAKRFNPPPLTRSATVPHITTMALSTHDNRPLSAGTMVKSSFKFPTSTLAMIDIGDLSTSSYSTNGLVPRRASSSVGSDDFVSTSSTNGSSMSSKSKPPRSIRGFAGHKKDTTKVRSKKQPLSEEAVAEVAATATVVEEQRTTDADGHTLVSRGVEYTDQLGALKPVPRVLIVEDNVTNRMILRTFLKKRGVSVVEAENGKLGVERFQEEVWRRQGRSGFEFVLMDLQMPVMDGNLATKRIREFEQSMVKQHGLSMPESNTQDDDDDDISDEKRQKKSVPTSEIRGYRPTAIFALTGLAGEEDKRLAFESGVDGYLTKPVSLKTLGALLSSFHPSHSEQSNPQCISSHI